MHWRMFLILLLLLPVVTVFSAQTSENRDYSLTVDVELVELPVSVIDKHGLSFHGLLKEHFAVYEDGVPQLISVFKQEDVPLSAALVIDTSGSMIESTDRLVAAASTFIRESKTEDETAIVSFGEDVFLENDFGDTSVDLDDAVSRMASNQGTAFFDAVYLAARHLQRKGAYRKKVLIVISDGEDNMSKYTLNETLKALGKWEITAYTVGLRSPRAAMYAMPGNTGKKALTRIAETTGGASFFPKGVNDVEGVCRRIAKDLRSQYTIGYRPTNAKHDGAWRSIRVRLDPPDRTPKLKVRTRQGYYAGRGAPESGGAIKESRR
jgi:VWFA-related protein